MPKLLWVALPLAAALGWWGWRVAAGRPPSRHLLNIAASLLLLAYLLTTASLGLFWVANQQLPVFDWHYLFGYATVLLAALHLCFNFPIVWRTLRPGGTAAGAARPWAARRFVLGALGLAGAGGVGFLVGRQQTVMLLQGGGEAAGVPSPSADAMTTVERLHALSSHSRQGVLASGPAVDWGRPPPPFKDLPGQRLALRPAPAGTPVQDGPALLWVLLFHSIGITQRRGGLVLRASPSSGALFSTELYADARGLPGLPDGLWHGDPRGPALVRLGEALAAEALPPAAAEAPLRLLFSAVFGRTGQKYRERTYRYLWADLGHALENLRQAAAAVGWQARLEPAFDSARIARALRVDEGEEGVLACVTLVPAGAVAAAGAGAVEAVAPLPAVAPSSTKGAAWRTATLPSAPRLGVTALAHAATSLQFTGAPPAAAAQPGSAARDGASRSAAQPLPRAPVAGRADILQRIARRRSVRRFAAAPIPLAALSGLLAGMAQPPLLSLAVRVHLVANTVEGLAPGAWAYDPAAHALRPLRVPAQLRDDARAAALDQDVIGLAAAVLVLAVDRAQLAADPLGPLRGYRHAYLEAGLVGERAYLEAAARGLGACAVGAFYDDEATALIGVDPTQLWPVHFCALGRPA